MQNIGIEVHNLYKTYKVGAKSSFLKQLFKPAYQEIHALNGINFNILPGQIIGFIGPNGAGKTTTIKILSGVMYPDSGNIYFDGENFFGKKKKVLTRETGLLLGHVSQLWWDLNVIDSLRAIALLNGMDLKRANNRIKELTDILEISGYLNRLPRELSLGQRMICDFAAAIIHSPRYLFLDEALIGLDIFAKKKIQKVLWGLAKEGVCILISSHMLNDIEMMCDKFVTIDKGKIIFEGTKKEIDAKIPIKSVFEGELLENVSVFNEIKDDIEIKKYGERLVILVFSDQGIRMVKEIAEKNEVLLKERPPYMEEIIEKLYKSV